MRNKLFFILFFSAALFCFVCGPVHGYAGPLVLFDQSHGQRFFIEKNRPLDLSGLAVLFVDQGATVTVSRASLTRKTLRDVDVLIIAGAFAPIRQSEIEAIAEFLERGGKLAVMIHIGKPFHGLLDRLGVGISVAPVYEQQHVLARNPRHFTVRQFASHPLTRGLEGFNVYGGWALLNKKKNTEVVAHTSDQAWIDMDKNGKVSHSDAVQSFPVIVAGRLGQGRFVVFADDAIFQNGFLRDGNLDLARNLALWFCPQRVAI
ncbi:DUF4350 domain-containing protein [Desulfolithobacter sp.]